METRELLNKRPAVTIAIVGMVAVPILFATLAFHIGHDRRAAANVFARRAFYTTDDGATLFVDDAAQWPPFDHDGHEAVRAHVLRVPTRKLQWVQYLEKRSAPAPEKGDMTTAAPAVLVKKPGSPDWVAMGTQAGSRIMAPATPDGGDPKEIQIVMPPN